MIFGQENLARIKNERICALYVIKLFICVFSKSLEIDTNQPMRPLIFILILIFLNHFSIHSQNVSHKEVFPFIIEGNINADTGTIHLEILVDSEYYPKGVESMVAEVNDKKFSFSGHIPYPQGMRFTYGNGYYSDIFILEPGIQSVIVDLQASREVPKVENYSMREFENEYLIAYKSLKEKRDQYKLKRDRLNLQYQDKLPDSVKHKLDQELKGFYVEGDSTLLAYVSAHPNSYIAFWKFVYLFSGWGYESVFESIFPRFSESLRNTYAGKALSRNLKVAEMLSVGKVFPLIPVTDIHDKKAMDNVFLKNEYTLVDFWFSNCAPCIAQFPHLTATYDKYRNKGFEIIGISTDKIKYKDNWKSAIGKYQLQWPQFWDKDGVEASKLSINAFPTNFLLNSQGKL